jgi:endonuclease/exonuclease/phosphatase (EEP) superfamily protein YafD
MSVDKKLQQMSGALEDLKQFPRDMPAVIVGDLNTWQPSAIDRTFKLFKDAGFNTAFDKESTFCRRLLFVDFTLKLDWIWLRGFESKSHGIDKKISVSDHYPLWSVIELKQPETKSE